MCIERSNGFSELQQCKGLLAKANDHKKAYLVFSWLMIMFLNYSFHSYCFRFSVDDKKSSEKRKGCHRWLCIVNNEVDICKSCMIFASTASNIPRL